MKTKKGFTLIELLAVIVILGIVIAIAIPGINSVINNARKNTYVETAKLYINSVRYGVVGEVYSTPSVGNALVVKTNDIQMEKGGQKSPYGLNWDVEFTYVVVANKAGKLVYYFAGRDTSGNLIAITEESEVKASSVGTGAGKTAASVTTSDLGMTGGSVSVYTKP